MIKDEFEEINKNYRKIFSSQGRLELIGRVRKLLALIRGLSFISPTGDTELQEIREAREHKTKFDELEDLNRGLKPCPVPVKEQRR